MSNNNKSEEKKKEKKFSKADFARTLRLYKGRAEKLSDAAEQKVKKSFKKIEKAVSAESQD